MAWIGAGSWTLAESFFAPCFAAFICLAMPTSLATISSCCLASRASTSLRAVDSSFLCSSSLSCSFFSRSSFFSLSSLSMSSARASSFFFSVSLLSRVWSCWLTVALPATAEARSKRPCRFWSCLIAPCTFLAFSAWDRCLPASSSSATLFTVSATSLADLAISVVMCEWLITFPRACCTALSSNWPWRSCSFWMAWPTFCAFTSFVMFLPASSCATMLSTSPTTRLAIFSCAADSFGLSTILWSAASTTSSSFTPFAGFHAPCTAHTERRRVNGIARSTIV
mmetsp:Transcript_24247/g.61503  ORF Transcript_24247/g.61503 Transcript_24247/m.61503 type:complete len:282 (-) Transcript_24247:67-912(-)